MKTLRLTALLALSLASAPIAASAQQKAETGQPSLAATIDDLLVCSMIYGRSSELYNEKGRPAEGVSFMSTSYAFSAVADLLALENYGEAVSQDFIDKRMNTLASSLNKAADAKERGEVDVIAEWIDYCDGLGPNVSATLPRTGLTN